MTDLVDKLEQALSVAHRMRRDASRTLLLQATSGLERQQWFEHLARSATICDALEAAHEAAVAPSEDEELPPSSVPSGGASGVSGGVGVPAALTSPSIEADKRGDQ